MKQKTKQTTITIKTLTTAILKKNYLTINCVARTCDSGL